MLASSSTLELKEEGAASRVHSTWLPSLSPDLLMSLSPSGGSGGEVMPAPEMPGALRLATKTPARPRIGHR